MECVSVTCAGNGIHRIRCVVVIIVFICRHVLYVPVERGECRTTVESIVVKRCHRLWYGNLGQLRAIGESIVLDGGEGVGERNGCELCAVVESVTADVGKEIG